MKAYHVISYDPDEPYERKHVRAIVNDEAGKYASVVGDLDQWMRRVRDDDTYSNVHDALTDAIGELADLLDDRGLRPFAE